MAISQFNLRHLQAFILVTETRNISIAAKRFHLSQPAISQAICNLEVMLKTSLFDRQPKGIYVNEAGMLLKKRAMKALSLLEEGITAAGRKAQTSSIRKATHLITSTHLRTLIAIQQAGNFTFAAKQLDVSQSSLHRNARHLEEVLGLDFFTATYKGVNLTEPAAIFARFAMLASSELQQAIDEINALIGQDTTLIKVGSLPLSKTSILPTATHALLGNKKGVQLSNVDGPYMELLHSLRHGNLDFLIGALRAPAPTDDIVQEKLFEDELAVIAGRDHPLANRPNLSLEDLKGYPWISPPSSTPTGQKIADFLGKYADEKGSPIRIISSSLVMVRGLLMSGHYLTLMSPKQMKIERDTALISVLNIELPLEKRPIGLTFRKGWNPTNTQAHFLDLVRKAAANTEERIDP